LAGTGLAAVGRGGPSEHRFVLVGGRHFAEPPQDRRRDRRRLADWGDKSPTRPSKP